MTRHLYGLLGKSLKHSFSKRFFSEKFEREGIMAVYELFELTKIDELPDLLLRHPGLRGLNVTIPYKEAVIPFLDSLSPEAEAVGAVNTIRIDKGHLSGHNTDVVGFERSLRTAWQGPWPQGALILGSGGAAKAVRHVLSQLPIPDLRIVTRSPAASNQLGYEALNSLDWSIFRLVVNTTPLGMYPDTKSLPPLPYERFSPAHLAFDLVYNPATTAFMRAAARQGADTLNGWEMLVGQAEAAWDIWQQQA